MMEPNLDKEKVEQPGDWEKIKKHFSKHKKKYIVGGLLAVGFVAGFYLGNRGNNKKYYQRLLKDGVKDAVEEGVRGLVENTMQEVVKDGMKEVVAEVIDGRVADVVKVGVKRGLSETSGHIVRDIKDSVKDNVKNAVKKGIEGSAVTIINSAVDNAPKTFEELGNTKKVFNYVNENLDLMQFRTDAAGNIYKIKVTV